MNSNNPSIRIPRVFPNITEDRIRGVFEDLDWGTISKIDMVARTNKHGEDYNLVFVHFESWSDGTEAVREALANDKEVKITYDDPWFWRITINKGHKRTVEEVTAYKTRTKKPTFSIEENQTPLTVHTYVDAALKKHSDN